MTGLLFKDLTQGSLIYVLAKYDDRLQYSEGTIVSVGKPRMEMPDYSKDTTQFVMPTTTRNVVDVTYAVDGKNYTDVVDTTMNLFSTKNIGNVALVTTDKDAVLRELRATLKSSEDYIAGVPMHKKRMASCKDLIAELDTDFAERQKIDERIQKLESSNAETNNLLKEILRKLNAK